MSASGEARSARPGGDGEAPPPILGRWRNLYLLVVGALAACIALFTWIGWIYR